MAGQHYCLRWNNYQSNMTSVFHQLLRNEAFVDVTLACNDSSLKAHKVVLSACSSYFQKLLMENPCKHPTIIMPQDVCFSDLKFIIEFVYRGEIDVSQAELQSLLKTADQLKIKGLCEVPDGKEGPVTPMPILSRRSFTKLRRLTGIKRQRQPEPLRRNIFKEFIDQQHQQPQQHPHQHPHPHQQQLLQPQQQQQQQQQIHIHQQPQHQHLQPNPMAIQHQLHHQHQQQMEMTELGANRPPMGPECVTVATSTEDDHENLPVVVLESRIPQQHQMMHSNAPTPVMTPHGMQPQPTQQMVMDGTPHSSGSGPTDVDIPPEAQPPAPSATLVENMDMHECTAHDRESSGVGCDEQGNVKVKFETLRAMEQADTIDIDSHMSERNVGEEDHTMHTMMITPELLGLIPSSSGHSDLSGDAVKGSPKSWSQESLDITDVSHHEVTKTGPKSWTQEDMELALDALRNHSMSLTKASATYGIPSTTLWQRAHRLGIDTPKKEGPSKSWTEDSLNSALEALRTGSISANKASKAYGIPSSTLYKIARREGIRLAAPFNAAPTTWSPDDLERALESIRSGASSVQRASTEFGIPTGTLYGRCKREGIELSRSNPTPWSEDAMGEALEAVRIGQMSINQAAIHYNLPYSSLYGRFKRCKYEAEGHQEVVASPPPPQIMVVPYQQPPPPPPPPPPAPQHTPQHMQQHHSPQQVLLIVRGRSQDGIRALQAHVRFVCKWDDSAAAIDNVPLEPAVFSDLDTKVTQMVLVCVSSGEYSINKFIT
ncbi:protein bric-a-brac 1 [Schistocerca americana]|uniref:protein bric-a-brac 1 n=1 Tax=Schistocerca americana TaxID=7009 RepID=UPI001F4F1889|nr:protein bric-a-brac 1 [Schistocerca americana]